MKRARYDAPIAVFAPLGILMFSRTSKRIHKGQAKTACGTPLFHGLTLPIKGRLPIQTQYKRRYDLLRTEMENLWGCANEPDNAVTHNQFFPQVLSGKEKQVDMFWESIKYINGRYQIV